MFPCRGTFSETVIPRMYDSVSAHVKGEQRLCNLSISWIWFGMGRLRLTVSKETGMAEGTLRALGPAFEVESDEAVESATSDSDSFDGFQPPDVDDAVKEKGLWRRLFGIV